MAMLRTVLLLAMVGVALPATAQNAPPATVFDTLARELNENLSGWGDKMKALLGASRPRAIAVWPFKADEVPVPLAVANGWTESLTDALVRETRGAFRLVTRTDVDAIARELAQSGDDRNPVPALLKAGKAGILVRGKVFPIANGLEISFSAVDVADGEILATTRRHPLPVDLETLGGAAKAVTLEVALAEAARSLAKAAPDMEGLSPRGVRHKEARVETAFGRYVADHVVEAIVQASAKGLNGRPVRLVDAAPEAFGARGVKVNGIAPSAGTADSPRNEGVYLLEGSYWPFSKQVELRLSLKAPDGSRHGWSGRIARTSIDPSLTLEASATGFGGGEDLGPIRLDLDSERGRDPVYRIGEKMVLLVRLDQDAYLHCFYRSAAGETMRIFPNRFHPSARLAGGAVQRIPSASLPFEFEISPPTGAEGVKCLALDRDPSRELPTDIAAKDLEPLPKALAERISDSYRRIPRLKVSEASLIVTVRK